MPHSYPDGGQPVNGFTTPDIQIAEIAPRIGSIDTYRRTGKVVLIDNFMTLNWHTPYLINGAATDIVLCREGISGGWRSNTALRITPSNTGVIQYVYKQLPVFENTRYGVEVNLTPLENYGTVTNGYYAYLDIVRQMGGKYYTAGLRVDFKNGKVSYYTLLGTYIDVITFTPGPTTTGERINIKLVADFMIHQTIRAYYNDQVAQINDAMNFTNISGPDITVIHLAASDADLSLRPVFFQDLIVTMDEA